MEGGCVTCETSFRVSMACTAACLSLVHDQGTLGNVLPARPATTVAHCSIIADLGLSALLRVR